MSSGGANALLRRRRFAPLFWTQFLGAFNDNLFKNATALLVAFRVVSGDEADVLVNLAAGLFILPFFLFSATAGQLADRVDKAEMIRWVKLSEIAIMALACLGFLFESAGLLLTVLFLMGTQSAFFGPVKYSILPQHLKKEELVGGNALVEMGTFVAILLGTILGGVLIAVDVWGPLLVGGSVVLTAIAGWRVSQEIPPAPSDAPDLQIDLNPLRASLKIIKVARRPQAIWLGILAISWFWFVGAILLAQFPGYARDILGAGEEVVTLLLAAFSVGIGIGSMLCERVSRGRVELGLVPVGALGLSLFLVVLFAAAPEAPAGDASVTHFLATSPGVVASLVMVGLFGGFYIVPLYALLQQRSERETRSQVIAANNIVNAIFMVGAALFAIVVQGMGFDSNELFLGIGLMNLAVAFFMCTRVPREIVRLFVRLVIRSGYRLKVSGLERIPANGGAVLVCNHVGFLDALIIAAASPRPIRFVAYHKVYFLPVINTIMRLVHAIPIAPRHEDETLMERAFDQIAEALDSGELVCIFPEGKVTSHGEMNTFKEGIERIIARTPVPVIPMALGGVWGSFFSRKYGKVMTRPFQRCRARISLVAGEPVPPASVSAERLYQRVRELRMTTGVL